MSCMVLSEEAILLLYGEKYLAGKWVFLLYLVVDLVKFANTGLILSAKGETKTLMYISLSMLGLNGVLNLLLYWCMGVIGPAVATVILTIATTVVLVHRSCQMIGTTIAALADWKLLGRHLLVLTVTGICGFVLRDAMIEWGAHYFLRLICVGSIMCGGLLLVNFRSIRDMFRSINQECKG